MPDIELDLSDDEVKELIDIYIRNNFTKESYSLYKDNPNGYMIASAIALRNEAIVSIVEEALNYDKMLQAQD